MEFPCYRGQKVYIDVFNASLSPVNISAQQVVGSTGLNLYHGVLGVNQSTTFTATMWGSEPLTYDLRFGVDGHKRLKRTFRFAERTPRPLDLFPHKRACPT